MLRSNLLVSSFSSDLVISINALTLSRVTFASRKCLFDGEREGAMAKHLVAKNANLYPQRFCEFILRSDSIELRQTRERHWFQAVRWNLGMLYVSTRVS